MVYIRQEDIGDEEVRKFLKSSSISMTCEYENCRSNQGMDYKRLADEKESGWEDEPIFLCDEHAKRHEPI